MLIRDLKNGHSLVCLAQETSQDESLYAWDEEQQSLTATIILFRKTPDHRLEVLIGQRIKEPMAESWACPGGHVEAHESATQGGIRELFEETGVKVKHLTPISITKSPSDRAVKNVVFATIIAPNTPIKSGSDFKNAKWVGVEQLPELAFDNKKYIVALLNGVRNGT